MSDSAPATTPAAGSATRRRLRRVALAVISISIALCVAETAARFVFPDRTLFQRHDRWIADERLGRRPRPDHVFESGGWTYSTNSLGLRDLERTPAPDPGVRRVLVVGDSFVYGVGAQETIFPQVAAHLLRKSGRDDLEVVPAGLPGYGTTQECVFLEHYLGDFSFDLLVLAFCVGNDLTENERFARDKRPRPPEVSLFDRLFERSRLVQVARAARRAAQRSGHSLFREQVAKRMRLARPALYEEPYGKAAERATVGALRRMREFAERHDAGFAVLLLPDEYQLAPALRATIHAERGTDEASLRPRLVQERVTAMLERIDGPVVDPFEQFAAARPDARLFIPYDTHYGVDGNRLVADALTDYVEGWFPR